MTLWEGNNMEKRLKYLQDRLQDLHERIISTSDESRIIELRRVYEETLFDLTVHVKEMSLEDAES